jgi:hypothetical protein
MPILGPIRAHRTEVSKQRNVCTRMNAAAVRSALNCFADNVQYLLEDCDESEMD